MVNGEFLSYHSTWLNTKTNLKDIKIAFSMLKIQGQFLNTTHVVLNLCLHKVISFAINKSSISKMKSGHKTLEKDWVCVF